jgi:hypothetical protein
MSYLLDGKTELTFRTASLVTEGGKTRSVVIESRPNYAVVKLSGTQTKYPVSWEHIFRFARDRYAKNLRIERQAAQAAASRTRLPLERQSRKARSNQK